MELKAGYKQTDVGVIPKDWDVKTLGSITTLLTNGFVGKAKDFYDESGEGILYLQGYNVEENGFNLHGIKRVSKEFHRQHKRSSLQTGDLLTIQTGDIGVSAIVPDRLAGANCHALVISRFDKRVADSVFYCQYFNSKFCRTFFKEIETGSTMKHLNVGDMARMFLPSPLLHEQSAIAAALSDMDALITALDRLIAKKRDIKQAAMQELLTGKRRLPGFSGEWVMKSLKTITRIPVTDGPHLTPRFLEDGIPFLSVNNLVDNRIDLNGLRYISKEDHVVFSKKCKPQKNDLLLGKAASVGGVAIVDLDMEFNIWSPIALIRVNNDNIPMFVYYSFQSEAVRRQIGVLTNSSSQGNIGMTDIERLVLLLPSREEQTAIAAILSEMDAEIYVLVAKMAKARQIKQGMMQELLTGRIRLVQGVEA